MRSGTLENLIILKVCVLVKVGKRFEGMRNKQEEISSVGTLKERGDLCIYIHPYIYDKSLSALSMDRMKTIQTQKNQRLTSQILKNDIYVLLFTEVTLHACLIY